MTRPRSLALLLVLVTLLAPACQKQAADGDAAKDGDTPAADSEHPAGTLAVLDGAPITTDAIFRTPELRDYLIRVRNQMIDMELTRAEFEKQGLKIEDAEFAQQKEIFYRQVGMVPTADQTAEQVFAAQFLAPRNMTAESFDKLFRAQHMATALVLKEHPITDAELQTVWKEFPKDQAVQRFGDLFNWTKPEDVTFESAKPLLEDIQAQQQVSDHQQALSQRLGDEARAASRLEIHRLPSEVLPESVAPAVEGVAAQAPAAGADFTPDPVAFVMDGKEYPWTQVLEEFPDRNFVDQIYRSVVQNAVLAALWEESEQTLPEGEVAKEMGRMKESAGSEQEYRAGLAQDNTTEAELEATMTQFLQLRQLLSAAFPVTDEEVSQQFQQLSPEDRERLAEQEGIADPKAATFEQLKEPLRKQMEGMKGAQSREPWIAEQMQKLIADGRLEIVDPRVAPPEPAVVPGMPQGAPPAPDGAVPPTPQGNGAPPDGE
ncbi:MAG TPA: hypothetical protein VEI97_16705 [bacterium]|nr:hypothetical protein [bacterium]